MKIVAQRHRDRAWLLRNTYLMLRTQGAPGAYLTSSGPTCQYRHIEVHDTEDKVVKCAIGMHIPTSEYTPQMEGNSLEEVIQMSPTIAALSSMVGEEFLFHMQTMHDNAARELFLRSEGRTWKEILEVKFKALAEIYSINFEEVKEIEL